MFSINTNNNAMAALQSLQQTNSQLSETQNEVSTGKSVSSAADNPAVYAISQAMNANISALSAVQSGLNFGAQVVATASTAASSISSTLSTLAQTITQGQTKGMNSATMNASITAALAQVDSFASSSTFNGVNLVAGAVGNGVTATSMPILDDTNGDSLTVGGAGTQAYNATSAGLGLSGLNVNSTGLQASFGSEDGTLAFDGNSASATIVTLQTANFGQVSAAGVGTPGTSTLPANATNVAQKYIFVLNDGTTNTALDTALSTASTTYTSTFTKGTTATGIGADTLVKSPAADALPGAITQLGNGNTQYTLTTATDANGNATQQVNVISVNISAEAANGANGNMSGTYAAGSTTAFTQGHTAIINDLTTAMTQVGFSATADANNTLTIAGNNLDTNTTDNNTVITNTAFGTGGSVSGNVQGTQVSGADVAIATVNAAVGKLGIITTALGNSSNQISGMVSFTSSLSDALTAGVGALTDADLATESAKLTSLQTKQQLAIQSLSIANQGPQSLLSLFK
jgi:flagellin